MTVCNATFCQTRAKFNLKGLKPFSCEKHKQSQFVNVLRLFCDFNGCTRTALFGLHGSKKRTHCIKHKKENFVKISDRLCTFDDCQKEPSFGLEGSTATRCSKHKEDNFINLKATFCNFFECKLTASFGLEGSTATKCSKHKEDNFINLKATFCNFIGCKLQASFGLEGSTATKCLKHKEDNFINLVSACCNFIGCKLQPSFGLEGSTATKCSKHKEDNFINLNATFCNFIECQVRATFGLEGSTATRCLKHREDGFINLYATLCNFIGCKITAGFGLEGSTATKCSKHKLPEMVNVVDPKCLTFLCGTLVHSTSRYQGYCFKCFVYLFPDNQIVHNYKTKERMVVDFIKASFPTMTWTWDRQVINGCSKKRPDLICDYGDQLIIIEIDENQHGSYDPGCENKRIMQLSQDVAHRPLVLIRFNPDSYRTREGVRHPGCFGFDESGNGRLVVTEHAEWEHRLSYLRTAVEHWTTVRTLKTIEPVSLFMTDNN